MASVHRDPRSPHGVWNCHLTLADGRRVCRSTRNRDKAQARILCDAWQETENEAAIGVNPQRKSLPYRGQALPARPQHVYFASSGQEVKIGLAVDPPRRATVKRSDRKPKQQQRVYFALSGRQVKIGLAKDPDGRVANLRVARPDIVLVGHIAGSREIERKLQNYFSKDRIGGEWYHFTAEIEAAINNLLGRNNVAPSVAMPEKPPNQKPVVCCVKKAERHLKRQWAEPKELSYEFDLPVPVLIDLCRSQDIEAAYYCRPGSTRGKWLINITSFYNYVRSSLPGGSCHFATAPKEPQPDSLQSTTQ
jgi:hypothetical protein